MNTLYFFCAFFWKIVAILYGGYYNHGMATAVKNREFRKMYNDYYPVVFNTIYSRIKNAQDAEDICHELFVVFYNKLEEIKEPRRWLLGSVRYEISSFYRKKGLSDSELSDIDDTSNDPNLAFENGFRDTRIIINEAIENEDNYKDEKERVLFELVAINKLTYDQAAKQLNLTRRQVEYKYSIIVKRILDYLEKKGITQMEDIL